MAGLAQRAFGRDLSSSVKVLASTITRLRFFAGAIAATVAASAAGFGRLVMIVGTAAASAAASGAISTPALASARRRGRIDVVADHMPAGGGEVFGKRAAHDAEADHADLAFLFRRHLPRLAA